MPRRVFTNSARITYVHEIAFITRNEIKDVGRRGGYKHGKNHLKPPRPSVRAVCTSSSGTARIALTTTGSRYTKTPKTKTRFSVFPRYQTTGS